MYIFGSLAAGLIKLIYATIRWEVVAPDSADEDRQVIYAFWHGRMLMLPEHYRRLKNRPPLYMLISQHGDGRLIAFAIKLLGIQSVAGSSTRRGMAATLELVRRLEEGVAIGITPDGPKGPRQVCKRGVVTMACHSGVAIRPVTYSTEERWVLPSWDRMIVPRPFSRGVVVFGDLLTPTPEGDEEEFRSKIEESLNAITERADAHWRAV
jgi:lysophospholipid acyltransferase (LPLAT)-like uncharacterized protein